jgi:PAS domain S-box-containing protein
MKDLTKDDFLLSIIGSAPYGIIALDLKGNVTMINQKAQRLLMLGADVNEVVDRPFSDFIGHVEGLPERIRASLAGKRPPFDLEGLQLQGRVLVLRGRRILSGYIVTVEDITHLKEMEAAALLAMLDGQEQERRRLARELHDGVGPMLSTIRHLLESVRADANAQPAVQEKFLRVYDLIDNIASEIRGLSHALMPKALVDFGLPAALSGFIRRMAAQEQVRLSFYHIGMDARLDQAMELGLYRIAQELTSNAVKHAQAQHFALQLIRHPHSVVLTAEDDGVGFDWSEARQREGIGLTNIETRVKSLGGVLDIDTAKGRGTMVSVEVPLPAKNAFNPTT